MPNSAARIALAREVLEGLSVGDAIGEALTYNNANARNKSDFSVFRPGTVSYTDDTAMALGIVECLAKLERIDEATLAVIFSRNFDAEPDRGYGQMAQHILSDLRFTSQWRTVSEAAFGGGSFGNGSAMRVAPVGAYFSDDFAMVKEMAAKSAIVTHYHPEGIAGAVAIAIASAAAVQGRGGPVEQTVTQIWDSVLEYTPESETAKAIADAREFTFATKPMEVARRVGCGCYVSCLDTVPFAIWNACRCLGDFREALVSTVEVGGDCDTNAAIVCGIVCAYCSPSGIPRDWLAARERLPGGPFT